MTPLKLTVRKVVYPRLQLSLSMTTSVYKSKTLCQDLRRQVRLYSSQPSQAVRHFTQEVQTGGGTARTTEVAQDLKTQKSESDKKWARHVMPSKEVLESQKEADESSKRKRKVHKRRRRQLKPLKAVLTLTPNAVKHLKMLSDQPQPKLIRVSVQNRGCSGLTYHLEYVDKAEKFDEQVTQDGATILVDSKALFSVIGSEMDWVDNKLASKFVFKNPNSKGTCGCGESFMV